MTKHEDFTFWKMLYGFKTKTHSFKYILDSIQTLTYHSFHESPGYHSHQK